MGLDALPFVDRDRLNELLTMADAIDSLDRAFAEGIPPLPIRTVHTVPRGQLLMMPAWSATALGVKLITYSPGNPGLGQPTVQGVYVLFDATASSPVAVFDGSAITELRTAAVSGVATRHLSRSDASRLRVYGTGVQARSHVRAMRAVRPITRVSVVGRDHTKATEWAASLRSDGLDAFAVDPTGLIDDDILCLCTTSPTPIVTAAQLPRVVHINAIGSFQPHTREIDSPTVIGSAVYVEDRQAVMDEAGDLLIPEGEGDWHRADIAGDLHDLSTGSIRPDAGRTLFKGVGMAYEDLIVANAAYVRI